MRPAKRPKGVEIRAFLRRLVGAIRSHWPQVEILLRADSHYACPEVLDWCEANGLDYVLGLAPTSTLKRHVGGLEESTSARFKAMSGYRCSRVKFYVAPSGHHVAAQAPTTDTSTSPAADHNEGLDATGPITEEVSS